ncbi:MAG: phosphoglucosamine mutase [Candidatus Krumholzibacteriota bacterium]|nr:phosphoglucosamine mutase [Candidatus Krumholzibacteriota bacterium]
MSSKLLFSVAGARGVVGETIDADVVNRLSLAFSSVLPDGPVVVGRDTRPSGQSFIDSVAGALCSTGRDVIDVGIAATPTVELVTEDSDAVGGIIVTASHNPGNWNALKFLDHRGMLISKETGDRLFAAFETNDFATDAAAPGSRREYVDGNEEHVRGILSLDDVDESRIRARGFKVVLDCINGAGSVIAPDLLDRLGCSVVCINCKLDGDFYRDPEPRPENLTELAERVRSEGADVGFACDPDADRLALVDNEGVAISEEYTLALAVDHVLSVSPGPVVVNMSTSSVIDDICQRHGVDLHRAAVGEAHVVARMLATHAVIGGEGNGGVIYPRFHPGRDALLGIAFVLTLLAERKCSIRNQIQEYPLFAITKEKMGLDGEFSAKRISDLLADLSPDRIDTQDGVKAVFADGWVHLRVSNTEGVVRVIAEGRDERRALALARQGRDIVAASWNRS